MNSYSSPFPTTDTSLCQEGQTVPASARTLKPGVVLDPSSPSSPTAKVLLMPPRWHLWNSPYSPSNPPFSSLPASFPRFLSFFLLPSLLPFCSLLLPSFCLQMFMESPPSTRYSADSGGSTSTKSWHGPCPQKGYSLAEKTKQVGKPKSTLIILNCYKCYEKSKGDCERECGGAALEEIKEGLHEEVIFKLNPKWWRGVSREEREGESLPQRRNAIE